MNTITIGMKRSRMWDLHREIQTALAKPQVEGHHNVCEVTLYGDVDEQGVVLTISNDDMERPEVQDNAIYAEVEEGPV